MEEYKVEELTNLEPGEFRHEVTAELRDDDLGKALIELGLLKEEGLKFCVIDGKPSVRFRVITPVAIHIYPLIAKAKGLFEVSIREARRLERLLEALKRAKQDRRPG